MSSATGSPFDHAVENPLAKLARLETNGRITKPSRALSRATTSSSISSIADSTFSSPASPTFSWSSASSISSPPISRKTSSTTPASPLLSPFNTKIFENTKRRTSTETRSVASYQQFLSRLGNQTDRARRPSLLEVANEPFNSHWGVIPDIAEEQIENSNQPVSSDRWRLTDATPHRLDRSSGSLDLGPTDFDPRVEIVKQLRPSVLLEDTEPISADRRQSLPDPALNTDKPQLELEIIRAPERVWHGGLRTSSSQETIGEDILLLEEQTAAPVHALPQLPELVDQREPILLKSDECSRLQNFPTTQITPKVRKADVDGSLRRRGRRKIVVQKHLTQAAQVSLNGLCIFATWWWSQYYYILLPLITATVALNVIMVAAILARRTWNAVVPEKIIMPKGPESMVLLVPCYNETEEELIKSLDSLTSQTGIEKHKQAIIIVCDGKVRGPGMAKTTADYLLLDILTHKTERRYLTAAYTAWDQGPMDVVVQRGLYNGLPYYCIIKQQNQGKRDGLIVARSFLYNFNRRNSAPNTVFSPEFFNHMATFLLADANIENVTHLIGMDADTVFDERCIWELLQQSRYADTVGVCGYVAVDWKASHWDLWRLYQSAEYTIAQGLRRLHQSLVTHKVSCLPGCCQLLRICEETCGDYVLLELFGYCPELDDSLLKQIRATASEDRNHVCHMLSARPQSQTRQALAAKAYTDVPRSWSVFLSQRRRWTLGATSNDLMLVFAGGVQWFERITAAINVLTWTLNPFIFASLASFIFAITSVPAWLIMCFVAVMLIPVTYYMAIPLWLCSKWRERFQFWAGCCMYVFCGPFINISVLLYAFIYMDSFGWGKTRKVIAEDSSSSTGLELERLSESESHDATSVSVSATEAEANERLVARDLDKEERDVGAR